MQAALLTPPSPRRCEWAELSTWQASLLIIRADKALGQGHPRGGVSHPDLPREGVEGQLTAAEPAGPARASVLDGQAVITPCWARPGTQSRSALDL